MFTKKRPDGTYIKDMHFFDRLLPYLMPTRSDAVIYFETEFDVTETLQYIHRKRREDPARKNLGLFYIILYASLRVLAQRPKMNRFVSGYRYYQRNRISFNFVAKRGLKDDGEELNVTQSFPPFISLHDFCAKIDACILSLKAGENSDSEKLNSFVAGLPRFIIRFMMRGVQFLDRHNALPMSAIDSLPFYSSIFFTHVGSVGIDAPFHHNFEIGNCGIFCAIGKLRKEYRFTADGTPTPRRVIKITYTFDDRIADGIYCARAVDMVSDLVRNPEKLEIPLVLTAKQIAALALAKRETAGT
ncbi:MAG: 2-oxo acid dehydrogenase subunit E2 [Spirochaetota bacterium]|nr:2-oxo acid dehydrogenase subunit E2 [Spirochaetota bacterium]